MHTSTHRVRVKKINPRSREPGQPYYLEVDVNVTVSIDLEAVAADCAVRVASNKFGRARLLNGKVKAEGVYTIVTKD